MCAETETRVYLLCVSDYDSCQHVWAGTDRVEALRRARELRDRIAKISARREELEPPDSLWQDTSPEGTREREAADDAFHATMTAEFGIEWSDYAWGCSSNVEVLMFDPVTGKFESVDLDEGGSTK